MTTRSSQHLQVYTNGYLPQEELHVPPVLGKCLLRYFSVLLGNSLPLPLLLSALLHLFRFTLVGLSRLRGHGRHTIPAGLSTVYVGTCTC